MNLKIYDILALMLPWLLSGQIRKFNLKKRKLNAISLLKLCKWFCKVGPLSQPISATMHHYLEGTNSKHILTPNSWLCKIQFLENNHFGKFKLNFK